MKILIMGANGFIGSHLLEHLCKEHPDSPEELESSFKKLISLDEPIYLNLKRKY